MPPLRFVTSWQEMPAAARTSRAPSGLRRGAAPRCRSQRDHVLPAWPSQNAWMKSDMRGDGARAAEASQSSCRRWLSWLSSSLAAVKNLKPLRERLALSQKEPAEIRGVHVMTVSIPGRLRRTRSARSPARKQRRARAPLRRRLSHPSPHEEAHVAYAARRSDQAVQPIHQRRADRCGRRRGDWC